MKTIHVRFEVRQGPDGWQLFAVPTHGAGWEPIPMTTTPRGTPGGALVEFATALYKLQEADEPAS